MAVPRHHMAKGKQLRRRSHLALKPKNLIACPHCGKPTISHQMCKFCGFYKGREIINVLAKELKKKERHKKSQK